MFVINILGSKSSIAMLLHLNQPSVRIGGLCSDSNVPISFVSSHDWAGEWIAGS